jgi:hypothetical protein
MFVLKKQAFFMHALILFIKQVLGLSFFLCKTSCKFFRKLLLAKASRSIFDEAQGYSILAVRILPGACPVLGI